jgi:hypothetical protein
MSGAWGAVWTCAWGMRAARPTPVCTPWVLPRASATRFNHSDRSDVCSVNWVTRAGQPCVEVRTRRAVPISDQLCISYGNWLGKAPRASPSPALSHACCPPPQMC